MTLKLTSVRQQSLQLTLVIAFSYNLALAQTSSDSSGMYQASFNCEQANTISETEICVSSVLADIDIRLADVYHGLQAQLGDDLGGKLRRQQLEWLQKRDACSQTSDVTNCLTTEMQTRLDDLVGVGQLQTRLSEDMHYLEQYLEPDDLTCNDAIQQSVTAFIDTHNAHATQPFAHLTNYWGYCLSEHAFMSYALESSLPTAISLLDSRDALKAAMEHYNHLAYVSSGGGSMFTMLRASAQQEIISQLAYSMAQHTQNPQVMPEDVLQRAGFGVVTNLAEQQEALEAAIGILQYNLAWDLRGELCRPGVIENYEEDVSDTCEGLEAALERISQLSTQLPPYLAYNVLNLADDMQYWFDVR